MPSFWRIVLGCVLHWIFDRTAIFFIVFDFRNDWFLSCNFLYSPFGYYCFCFTLSVRAILSLQLATKMWICHRFLNFVVNFNWVLKKKLSFICHLYKVKLHLLHSKNCTRSICHYSLLHTHTRTDESAPIFVWTHLLLNFCRCIFCTIPVFLCHEINSKILHMHNNRSPSTLNSYKHNLFICFNLLMIRLCYVSITHTLLSSSTFFSLIFPTILVTKTII